MNLVGTIALFFMITTWTANGKEINFGFLKFIAFFVVLASIWWKP